MSPHREGGSAPLPRRLAIVGDFLPPTVADEVVFDAALAMSPHVQVLLVTAEDDPLDVLQRVAWLQQMAPRAGIVPVPAAPATDGAPKGLVELNEVLASSSFARPEALVGPGLRDLALARALGLPYLPVDVSSYATDTVGALRRPLGHWDTLPPAVRAHFLKRVVVMGPESSGKTTLARDLAREYQTVWTSEYLRIYLDAKGDVCEPGDLPQVVAGHVATEAALARRARRVLFCDTDPLMTAVYSRFYYGTLPAWLDAAADARRADHYLLLDCDVPWVADDQRDAPHARDVIRDLCQEELRRRQLPFTLVGGTWEHRLATARRVVDGLLQEG